MIRIIMLYTIYCFFFFSCKKRSVFFKHFLKNFLKRFFKPAQKNISHPPFSLKNHLPQRYSLFRKKPFSLSLLFLGIILIASCKPPSSSVFPAPLEETLPLITHLPAELKNSFWVIDNREESTFTRALSFSSSTLMIADEDSLKHHSDQPRISVVPLHTSSFEPYHFSSSLTLPLPDPTYPQSIQEAHEKAFSAPRQIIDLEKTYKKFLEEGRKFSKKESLSKKSNLASRPSSYFQNSSADLVYELMIHEWQEQKNKPPLKTRVFHLKIHLNTSESILDLEFLINTLFFFPQSGFFTGTWSFTTQILPLEPPPASQENFFLSLLPYFLNQQTYALLSNENPARIYSSITFLRSTILMASEGRPTLPLNSPHPLPFTPTQSPSLSIFNRSLYTSPRASLDLGKIYSEFRQRNPQTVFRETLYSPPRSTQDDWATQTPLYRLEIINQGEPTGIQDIFTLIVLVPTQINPASQRPSALPLKIQIYLNNSANPLLWFPNTTPAISKQPFGPNNDPIELTNLLLNYPLFHPPAFSENDF